MSPSNRSLEDVNQHFQKQISFANESLDLAKKPLVDFMPKQGEDYTDHRMVALLETNKKIEAIDDSVKNIDGGLTNEREERKQADEANFLYSKKWNRINLVVAISGVLFGLIGCVVALLSLF